MPIPFQPPEWLLQEYMNRKQPAQVASEGLQGALQTYAALKQQQSTQELAKQAKDVELAKASADNGQDFWTAYNQLRQQRGAAPVSVPGAGGPAPVVPSTGTVTSPQMLPTSIPMTADNVPIMGPQQGPPLPGIGLGLKAQQTPRSGIGAPSPLIDHWNQTVGMAAGTVGASPTPSVPGIAAPSAPASAPGPLDDPAIQEYMKIGSAQYKQLHGTKGLEKVKTAMDLAKSAESFQPTSYFNQQGKKQFDLPSGSKLLSDTGAQDQKIKNEQDRLEGQAIQRLSTLRGDTSMARTESQRDASIVAYNTIHKAIKEGRELTKAEYYDTLGQLWKARTGASPTDQSLRDLDTKTLHGDVNNAVSYFTGQPKGATTQDNLLALRRFVADSGMQADKLHAGYMRSHLIKPSGLEESRWQNIVSGGRGMTFAEATGYQEGQDRVGGGNLDTQPVVEQGYAYTPGPGGRANKANWKKQ